MAGAGDIRAGRAYVELGVEDKTDAALDRAAAKVKAFGAGVRTAGLQLAALGALISAPLTAAAIAAAKSGEALYDMSKRTGISAERLSALGYAAVQTGTDLDTFEKGIRQMQKSIVGIEDATQGTVKGLRHIGIAASEVAGLSPEKQFDLVARKIAAIQDPTLRATAAMKVFGRTGTALLPMIESLNTLEGQAKRFGFIKTEAEVRRAKEFSLALRVAGLAGTDLSEALAQAVMPVIKETTERMTEIILRIRDWVKLNPQLIATIFKVAVGVGIAGTAIAALGTAFIGLGSAVAIVATVVGAIGTVLGVLLSPIGLIVTAMVALGGYLLYTSGAGKRAVDVLIGAFRTLKADVQGVADAIQTAFAGGDLVAAARVGIALLRLEWARGVAAIRGFIATLVPYFQWAFDNFKNIAAAGWAEIVASASAMADKLKAIGGTIWDFFKWGIGIVVDRFKWLGTQVAAIFSAMLANIKEFTDRLVLVLNANDLSRGPIGQMQALLKLRDMGAPTIHTPAFTAQPAVPPMPGARSMAESQATSDLRDAAKKLKDAITKSFSAISGDPAFAHPKGLLEPGNLDLQHRPQVFNPAEGGISTVWSMSFEEDNKQILVPRISLLGKILSAQEAIDNYHRTHQHLGIFGTVEDANAYAEALHKQQEALLNPEVMEAQQALADAIKAANAVPAIKGLKLGADPSRFSDAIGDAMGKTSSAGTFNPFGAGQLGGPLSRIEINTGRAAAALDVIKRAGALRPMHPAFS